VQKIIIHREGFGISPRGTFWVRRRSDVSAELSVIQTPGHLESAPVCRAVYTVEKSKTRCQILRKRIGEGGWKEPLAAGRRELQKRSGGWIPVDRSLEHALGGGRELIMAIPES